MIHLGSEQSRRLIGRLDAGDELIETITELCEIEEVRAGELRVLGALRHVELVRHDPKTDSFVTVYEGDAPADIVLLTGNVAHLAGTVVLRMEGLLSLQGPLGPQLVSGQIRRATVTNAEFVLDWFEDLEMIRRPAPGGGLPLLELKKVTPERAPASPAPATLTPTTQAVAPAPPTTPKPAPVSRPAFEAKPAPRPPAATPTPEPTPARPAPTPAPEPDRQKHSREAWAQAAQEADARSIPAPPSVEEVYGDLDLMDDLPEMEPGDIVDHPKFGRCRIMKVEDDEYVFVRLPSNRISRLGLEFFEVTYEGEDERNRKVFKLRKQR